MLSEETTTTAAPSEAEEPVRCEAGSSTDTPCWRVATELRWHEDDKPKLCAEHARWLNLGEEEDAWRSALEAIEEWIRGPVSEDDYGHLDRLATNMRDDTRREYAAAVAKARAARLVAQQGPPEDGEPHLAPEQSEEFARLIIRADSFVDARAILEDTLQDVLGRRDRWVLVDALAAAAGTANEEVGRYKREIGLLED